MKLFNVSVKHERERGARKWVVFRYVAVAESAQAAEQMVREQEVGSRKVIDICAREVEGGIAGRDNYLADNGAPFKRNAEPPLIESPIFGDQ